MKRALVFLLALAVVFSLAACGGKKDDPNAAFAGTYEGVHAKFVGDTEWIPSEGYEAFSLTLKADGTGVHSRNGMEFKVTWALDGENFTMNETFIGDPIVYTGTLKDGELHLYNNTPDNPFTYEYVYKKG